MPLIPVLVPAPTSATDPVTAPALSSRHRALRCIGLFLLALAGVAGLATTRSGHAPPVRSQPVALTAFVRQHLTAYVRHYGPAADRFLTVVPNVAESDQLDELTVDDALHATDLLDVATERGQLLSEVTNPELKALLNELYRPGATIGDGGTAAALGQEVRDNDELVRASGAISFQHYEKAVSYLKSLGKLVKSKTLGPQDDDIALGQINQLSRAVESASNALTTTVEIGHDLGLSAVTSVATDSLATTGDRVLAFINEVLEDAAAGA
jgi:hypothetical protein